MWVRQPDAGQQNQCLANTWLCFCNMDPVSLLANAAQVDLLTHLQSTCGDSCGRGCTFSSLRDTPQLVCPSSFSVSIAAMPTQFLGASRVSLPPSPSMLAISTWPGLSGKTVAVTVSPSPCRNSEYVSCADREPLMRWEMLWDDAGTSCAIDSCSSARGQLPPLRSPSSQSLGPGLLLSLAQKPSPPLQQDA